MKTSRGTTLRALAIGAALAGIGALPGAGQQGAVIARVEGQAPVPRAEAGAGCAQQPDDGVYESALGFGTSQNAAGIAQRFEPPAIAADSYWFLDDVCLVLTRNGSSGASTFAFAVFADEGGLPGDLLGLRFATTELPAFPGSMVCAGDFALSLMGLDAIHVGVGWDPQQANVFLMMDESPSTPAQTVSARSSSTGFGGLGAWSPVTTIDPDFRAAGIGITLFASTPDLVTTVLPSPDTALRAPGGEDVIGEGLLGSGEGPWSALVPRQDEELQLIGGVAAQLNHGADLYALVVYRAAETTDQTWFSFFGPTDAPAEGELREVEKPFPRARSLGDSLARWHEEPDRLFVPAVDGTGNLWVARLSIPAAGTERARPVGRAFPEIEWEQVAAGNHLSTDAAVRDGDPCVAAQRVSDFTLQQYCHDLDSGWALDRHIEAPVLSGGNGALGPELVTLPSEEGDSLCTVYSRAKSASTYDVVARCGGASAGAALTARELGDSTLLSDQQLATIALDSKLVDLRRHRSKHLSVASGTIPGPAERGFSNGRPATLFGLVRRLADDRVRFACVGAEDGRLFGLGDADLFQGPPGSWAFNVQGERRRFSVEAPDETKTELRRRFYRLEDGGDLPNCHPQKIGWLPAGLPLDPFIGADELDDGCDASKYEDAWSIHEYRGFHAGPPTTAAGARQLMPQPLSLTERRTPRPCVRDVDAHCLSEGRFEVTVDWRTQQGASGDGQRVDLTGDSGLFYFFDPDNLELIAKVLDACSTPFQSFWVFTAGLTDVEYVMEVFDSESGARRFFANPLKTAARPVQDTRALSTCGFGAGSAGAARAGAGASDGERAAGGASAGEASWSLPGWAREALAAREAGRRDAVEADSAATPRAGDCTSGPTTLCLGGGRFKVEVEWVTKGGSSGDGQAIPLTGDTGAFWFFNQENVEVLVKVLDACASAFDSFWVFAAGLTNVEVRLTVTDTQTGMVKVYDNPLDRPFQPIQDTRAFATCP